MKQNLNSFAALSFILCLSLFNHGCGSDGTNDGNSNRSPVPQPSQININQPTISEDKVFQPSPYCRRSIIIVNGLDKICNQIRPEVVESLFTQNLLIKTLQDINAGTISVAQINKPEPIKKVAPTPENNLTKNDIPLIADEINRKLNEKNQTHLETETQQIANKVNTDLRQALIVLTFIAFLLLWVLLVVSWWYLRTQFLAVLDSIDRMPHQKGSGVSTYNKDKDPQPSKDKDSQHLQKILENLTSEISDGLAENKKGLDDLRKQVIEALWSGMGKAERHSSERQEGNRGTQSVQLAKSENLAALRKGNKLLSVEGYQEDFRSDSINLTLDRYGENLIETEGHGEYLLIKLDETEGLVIPNYPNFHKPELFSSYFQNFYERTGSMIIGEVWIKKPAVFRKYDEGWKLKQEKGELEIR